MSELIEEQQFWNEFAWEYTQIQDESQTTIVTDFKKFLKKLGVLPTKRFVDIAGGSGKYVGEFLEEVEQYTLVDFSAEMLRIALEKYPDKRLIGVEMDQDHFLQVSKEKTYDVVFSAMNPALRTKQQLMQLSKLADKYLCILRVVKEEDSLFTPVEKRLKVFKEEELMGQYRQWINRPYQTQRFTYVLEEEISKEFFKEYFIDDFSSKELDNLITQVFKQSEAQVNHIVIEFEIIVIPTS